MVFSKKSTSFELLQRSNDQNFEVMSRFCGKFESANYCEKEFELGDFLLVVCFTDVVYDTSDDISGPSENRVPDIHSMEFFTEEDSFDVAKCRWQNYLDVFGIDTYDLVSE